MEIELAEQQAEGIWILRLLNGIRPRNPQPIGNPVANEAFEQTGLAPWRERRKRGSIGPAHDIDLGGTGEESADDASVGRIVRSEDAEGVVVRAESERARRLLVQSPGWFEPCLSDGGLRCPSR
jgi:hypothetical protein